MNDVYVLALFCVIGYAMVKARIPLAPLILGVVLGDQIEANLIQAVSTDANPWLFVTRPISGAHARRLGAVHRRSRSGSTGAKRNAPPRRPPRKKTRISRPAVMPALVAGIHVFFSYPKSERRGMAGDKPGHDTERHTRALPVGRGTFPYL